MARLVEECSEPFPFYGAAAAKASSHGGAPGMPRLALPRVARVRFTRGSPRITPHGVRSLALDGRRRMAPGGAYSRHPGPTLRLANFGPPSYNPPVSLSAERGGVDQDAPRL